MKTLRKSELFIHDHHKHKRKKSNQGKIYKRAKIDEIKGEEKKQPNKPSPLHLTFFLLFGIFIAIGVGGYYFVQTTITAIDIIYGNDSSSPPPPPSSLPSPENSILIIATTTTTSTTTTTIIFMTTSTTLSTTTTTTITIEKEMKCGGDWEDPCENESDGSLKCDPGNVIGSEGLCHTPECAPSVPSGRKGSCGAFALRYCQK
jgi:hypothetical protein